MRGTAPAALAAVALVLTFALASPARRAGAQGPPPGGPGSPPAGAAVDSFAAERDSMIQAVLERLGDRRGAASESVFEKIDVMKGVPAERLLARMNAFSRALGVGCRHCHVPGQWADEDKRTKEIARQMMKMNGAINEQYMSRIDFGPEEKPSVNCMTCHRGEAEPMAAARRAMRRADGPGGPRPGGRR